MRRLPDGRVALRLKRTMHDGTQEVAFTPTQLLRRLAALVPPARWNQTRYFGVFASRAKLRKKIVPTAASVPPSRKKLEGAPTAKTPAPYKLPWAALLARTFLLDILLCHCGGQRKVLAFIPQPRMAQETLRRLGLPFSPAPISPPRWASQDEFELPRDYGGADPPFYEEPLQAL